MSTDRRHRRYRGRPGGFRSAGTALGLILLTLWLSPLEATGQQADTLDATLRLDRGPQPVVVRGDEVRIYYEVSTPAHVAIFRVDTDGRGTLLFPQYPNASTRVDGGREHRLILPESRRWEVEDADGEGWFIMIASEEPLDFSVFDFDVLAGWVLTTVTDARYSDPYEAIDDYVVAVLPGWEESPYTVDLVPYQVVDEETRAAMGVLPEPGDEADPATEDTGAPVVGPQVRVGPSGEAGAGEESAEAEGAEPDVAAEEDATVAYEEERPSARAPRTVIVLPPAVRPRYAPPPGYRLPARYGPPPPRYLRWRGYPTPAPRYYRPAPHRSPRVRAAPPAYRRPPGAAPRRYKERPVRRS